MRKCGIIAAVLVTLAAAALYTPLAALHRLNAGALPPGIRRRECRVVRLWLVGEPGEGEMWLKQQAAVYEKQAGDVRIYLRRAEPDELEAGVPQPDGVVFTPGTLTGREDHLLPLAAGENIAPEILRAGQWRGETRALPLCMAGYVWIRAEKGEGFTAAAGMPLLLAASLAERPSVGTAPEEWPTQQGVYEAFTRGACAEAVLTLDQLRILEKRAEPAYTAGVFPLAATDRYWLGGVAAGKNNRDALAFFHWLTQAQAQQTLGRAGLFSVREGMDLYAPADGVWDAQEEAFRRAAALPNAFAAAPGRLTALGHTAFQLGEDPAALLETLR